MQTVFQFDHGNPRDDDLGFSVLLFEFQQHSADRFGATLGGDQNARVED
jgi:hypothetical protein